MKRGMPPRGAVFNGRPMMMAFDVDCGEVIPGHHFIARGLGGPFRLPILDDWDGDSAECEQMLEFGETCGYPGLTLEYELIPGIPAQAGGDLFVISSASPTTRTLSSPGGRTTVARSPRSRAATRPTDSAGDWPLPPNATVLTFSIAGIDPAGFTDRENPAGDLVVNVLHGNAAWRPAGAGTER
jgi:hypothetical protein